MALAEPYRSTVLYRYLDELPTRAVAARMRVSASFGAARCWLTAPQQPECT